VLKDLHQLPKVRDSLSYLYLEHGRVDRYQKSIAFHNADGMMPIPAASLAVLMLGPGTDITHAAVAALADNNCLVAWCGENAVRFYASGMGGTRSSTALAHQAWLVSDEYRRLEVVRRMYEIRFGEPVDRNLTVQQLRGMEGARVRAAYTRLSEQYGVAWSGRSYNRTDWSFADPINRANSAANSCLYGVCHAAVL
jgi:CRISP-associated protein Cas1